MATLASARLSPRLLGFLLLGITASLRAGEPDGPQVHADVCAQVGAPAASTKQPVPPKADRDARKAEVDSIFEPAKAVTPAAKAALAERVLTTGQETTSDPIARFVLLNLARELACDAAKMQVAFAAIELLEPDFEFDADAVRIATISQGAKSAVPPDQKQEVLTFGTQLAQKLMADDRYADASKLFVGLSDVARRARDLKTANLLAEQRKLADTLEVGFLKVKPAFEVLKQTPDDVAANLTAGNYYLLAKGDAPKALPHLAKSGDTPLASAAKLELTDPQNPIEQEKLADLWWDIASKEPAKESQQKFQSRSLAWYQKAKPYLKGLAVAKADLRMKQMTSAGVQPAATQGDLGIFSRPPGERPAMPDLSGSPPEAKTVELPKNLIHLVDVDKDSLNQKWERVENGIAAPPGYGALLQLPLAFSGTYEVHVKFTRETGNDIVGVVLPTSDGFCDVLLSTDGGVSGYLGNGSETRIKFEPSQLENGHTYHFSLRVVETPEGTRVDANLDDLNLGTWKGKGTANTDGDRKMRSRQHLGLYAHESRVVFHSVEVKFLQGTTLTLDEGREPPAKEAGDSSSSSLPSSSNPVVAKVPENVLDLVDVKRDAISQVWERREKEIIALPAEAPLLQLPLTITGSYVFTVEFTRETEDEVVGLILPVHDRFCSVLLSARGGDVGYIGIGDPKAVRLTPSTLENNHRYKLIASVTAGQEESSVEITLDGVVLGKWTGAGTLNENGGTRTMRKLNHIGLYAHLSRVVFHSSDLKMIDGSVTVDDSSPAAPTTSSTKPGGPLPRNLLELANPEVHPSSKKWSRVDTTIVSGGELDSRLYLPVKLPKKYELFLDFTREEGANALGMVVPVEGKFLELLISHRKKGESVIGFSENRVFGVHEPIENGKRYQLAIRVASDGDNTVAQMFLAGEMIANWKGPAIEVVDNFRTIIDGQHPSLFAHGCKVVFHSLELRVLDGTAVAD